MKSIRNILVVISMVLVGVAANAQTVLHGKFVLTSEAHWGKAVLPAGEYTFTMSSVQSPIIIQAVKGKAAAMVLAETHADVAPGGSYILITADGQVRSMNLPQLGTSLIFRPLTSRERETLYASTSRTVPVQVAAR